MIILFLKCLVFAFFTVVDAILFIHFDNIWYVLKKYNTDIKVKCLLVFILYLGANLTFYIYIMKILQIV